MAAEKVTLARPHAQALYAAVCSSKQVPAWSAFLEHAAQAVMCPEVAALGNHPRADGEFWVHLFAGLPTYAGVDPVIWARFVETMVHFRRMLLLPEVAQEFESLRRSDEGRKQVHVVSASPLSPAQEDVLKKALSQKLGCVVDLTLKEDPTLLAGVIVQLEDTVWDGSLRHRLNYVAEQLMRA